MSILSLQLLSGDALITHIQNGGRLAFFLNVELSNEIFNRGFDSIEYNDAIIDEISTKFNITTVDMHRAQMEEEYVTLLSRQNVESLVFGVFPKLGFKNFRDRHGGLQVDLLIKKALKNTHQLKHLQMSGYMESDQFQYGFNPGWAKAISRQLYFLKSLILSGRDLEPTDFQDICKFCVNLDFLDISDTGITTLNGIAKLEKLEKLAIGGLDISGFDMLPDLPHLTNLKVLDLASKRNFQQTSFLFANYWNCCTALSNLEFIDCSLNFVTNHMIEWLIRYHPNIQMISLIGTEVTISSIPGVELITTSSIEASIKALSRYPSHTHGAMLSIIMSTSRDKVLELGNTKEERLIKRAWINSVFRLFENSSTRGVELVAAISNFSKFFMRKFSNVFTIRLQHRFFKQMYLTWNSFSQREEKINRNAESYEFHQIVWSLFKKERILKVPNLDLIKVYKSAQRIVLNGGCGEMERDCLKAMHRCLKIMCLTDLQHIYEDVESWKCLVDLLNPLCRRRRIHQYRLTLNLLRCFAEYSPDAFCAIGGLNRIVAHLKKFNCIQSYTLLKIVINSSANSALLNPDNVRNLLKSFRKLYRHVYYQPTVPMFTKKMYTLASFFSIVLAKATDDQRSLPKWRIVDQCLQNVFEELKKDDPVETEWNSLDFIEETIKNQSPIGSIHWAAWTLGRRVQELIESDFGDQECYLLLMHFLKKAPLNPEVLRILQKFSPV